MLERLSEQIQACHVRAADAKFRADTATDPALKASFLDMEERWLALARSYAFTESLGHFQAAISDQLSKHKRTSRRRLPVADGLFDRLPVAIYVCDPDGLILFYNR